MVDTAPHTTKRKIMRSPAAQTVTANMLFPLLLLIPGVREWVSLNPEAYVSLQGLLNVGANLLREKLRK